MRRRDHEMRVIFLRNTERDDRRFVPYGKIASAPAQLPLLCFGKLRITRRLERRPDIGNGVESGRTFFKKVKEPFVNIFEHHASILVIASILFIMINVQPRL